ncbi:MAG: hypothetical protein ACODAD_15760, partial [Planctomycetota bacterium]
MSTSLQTSGESARSAGNKQRPDRIASVRNKSGSKQDSKQELSINPWIVEVLNMSSEKNGMSKIEQDRQLL